MENMNGGKKMNWGTLVLGIIIGAVVVWVVMAATRPSLTEGQSERIFMGATLTRCEFIEGSEVGGPESRCTCGVQIAREISLKYFVTLSSKEIQTSSQCLALNGQRIGNLFTPVQGLE